MPDKKPTRGAKTSGYMRTVSFTACPDDDVNRLLSKGCLTITCGNLRKHRNLLFCTFLCPMLLQLAQSFTHIPNFCGSIRFLFHKHAVCDTQHVT